MSYKIGYIASRVGVPSKSEQRAALISYGVSDNDIYETTKDYYALDDCLAALREGDELVVYTVAIFGKNKLNSVFVETKDAYVSGIYSVKWEYLFNFEQASMKLLAEAWEELNETTNRLIGAIGREKGGRKPGKAWDKAKAICAAYNEGMALDELASIHDVSTSTIRRMINSYEGKE